MSTCWKCGKQLPEGQVECPYDCSPATETGAVSRDSFVEFLKRMDDMRGIDWDKVQSFADLKALLAALFKHSRFLPDDPELKRFLKEGE